jgi:hypothetical protein
MKEDVIYGAYLMHGRDEKYMQNFSENLKEKTTWKTQT